MLPASEVEVFSTLLQGTADVALVSFGIVDTILSFNIFPGITSSAIRVRFFFRTYHTLIVHLP